MKQKKCEIQLKLDFTLQKYVTIFYAGVINCKMPGGLI